MNGGDGLTGQSPLAACRSVWQTPQAAIVTSTWPGPGSGIGTSSMTRGCPSALTTAARIVFAIVFIPARCRSNDRTLWACVARLDLAQATGLRRY
jgi:hypothetical protein